MGRDDGGLVQKDFDAGTLAFDISVLFRTGCRGINFGVSVRNLAPEVTYVDENFELPLTFRIGTAININELARLDTEVHSFHLSIDAERPRSYDEQLRIGVEYLFLDALALRAGYAFPTDEQGINLGAGIQSGFAGARFNFDYAYTRFGVFGNVHRLALKLGF